MTPGSFLKIGSAPHTLIWYLKVLFSAVLNYLLLLLLLLLLLTRPGGEVPLSGEQVFKVEYFPRLTLSVTVHGLSVGIFIM